MSYANAHVQLIAALDAVSGLHQSTDTSARDQEDIEQASNEGGQVDGSYILAQTGWAPYEEVVTNTASNFWHELEFQVRCSVGSDGIAAAKGKVAKYLRDFWNAVAIPSSVGADVCSVIPGGSPGRVYADPEGKRLYARYSFRIIVEEN